MALDDNIKTALLSRLRSENLLSESSAELVITALEKESPVNWNLILNKEITPSAEHETTN